MNDAQDVGVIDHGAHGTGLEALELVGRHHDAGVIGDLELQLDHVPGPLLNDSDSTSQQVADCAAVTVHDAAGWQDPQPEHVGDPPGIVCVVPVLEYPRTAWQRLG